MASESAPADRERTAVRQLDMTGRESGPTPACNCASHGLLVYWRHGYGCPYGTRMTKIASEQRREDFREQETGMRAPEGCLVSR